MKFLVCPRCDGESFEPFSRYGVCHDCNYFEVKRTRTRRISEKTLRQRKESYHEPHPFREECQNKFTPEDHKIVRRALLCIPEDEQRVVFMHFWKDQKKDEIAERLGITRSRVDEILVSAYERLRTFCLEHPHFSRGFRRLLESAA